MNQLKEQYKIQQIWPMQHMHNRKVWPIFILKKEKGDEFYSVTGVHSKIKKRIKYF